MTALAITPNGSLFDRLESPTAGQEASLLKKIFLGDVERLKLDNAITSGAFNDLHKLAFEYGLEVQQVPVMALAQKFLYGMPANIAGPELDLDQDSEIVFDWKGSFSRMMTVTLRNDGRVSFAARLSPSKSYYGYDQFYDSVPSEIVNLVRQVTQSQ